MWITTVLEQRLDDLLAIRETEMSGSLAAVHVVKTLLTRLGSGPNRAHQGGSLLL